jgi:hypothetical protein
MTASQLFRSYIIGVSPELIKENMSMEIGFDAIQFLANSKNLE